MKNLIQLKASRAVLLVVTVAAAIAGATGIAAGQGTAATGMKTETASLPSGTIRFKHPTLKHGVLSVTGTRANERITLRLQAGNPAILQVDVGDDGSADFEFEREEIARIAVNARAGDDVVRIDDSNGPFTDSIPTRLRGGAANDTLGGGLGAETLFGGDGNDSIDGNGGADVALMGAGDDTFVWDPGDGSDIVEGQDGADTMRFNGSVGNEVFEFLANGGRLMFTRDLGNIVMDVDEVEQIDLEALGGTDQTTVNDLSGTDVENINVDLEGVLGGGAVDGAADAVTVNATDQVDVIDVAAVAGEIHVTGLTATVRIAHADPLLDQLIVNTRAGIDQVNVGAGVAVLIGVTVNQ